MNFPEEVYCDLAAEDARSGDISIKQKVDKFITEEIEKGEIFQIPTAY